MFELASLTAVLRSSSRLLFVHNVVHLGMTRLVQGWDSDANAEDHHILFRCNVVQLRAAAVQPSSRRESSGPSTCQRCCFLMEANGWQASTVAQFKQARRRAQGVAELGYVSLQCVRFMAARILPSVQQRS